MTWEDVQAEAETWRLADGPPEDVGIELVGADLWPESTTDARFAVGAQQFIVPVIYPLSPEGRVFPCELVSVADE